MLIFHLFFTSLRRIRNYIIILIFISKILVKCCLLNAIFFIFKLFFKDSTATKRLKFLSILAIVLYEGSILLINLDMIELTEISFTL